MKIFFCYGAMYAEVEEGDRIDISPIELGDTTLYPGEFVQRLGEKDRTSFEMNDGYYLRYVGMSEEVLLFAVNQSQRGNTCYAFHYIDQKTLLVGGRNGCRHVVIERLNKFTNIPEDIAEITEQLSLF